MRKVFIVLFMLFFIAFSSYGTDDPEATAKEIIKAYRTRDAALLKTNITGIMKYAISDNFFESKDAREPLQIVDGWDGFIKGVKYGSDNIMGKTVQLAVFHLSDAENGDLNVAVTTRLEDGNWAAFTYGIMTMTRPEYDEFSDDTDAAAKEAKKDHSKFTIENALGEIKKDPTSDDLTTMLTALSDDNFFLTLTHETDGFIQTSYSADGYEVQFRDQSGYFSSSRLLDLGEVQKLFCGYIDGADGWNKAYEWDDMETMYSE